MKKFKIIRTGMFAIGLVVAAGLLGEVFSPAHAANTLMATSSQIITPVTTDGLPPNGTNVSYVGSSADGNVVLFISNATNLANAGSISNGLYVYNIKMNTTSRVDISTSGALPDNNLFNDMQPHMYISETGRYVTFASKATNLIDGSTAPSNSYAIYIRDTQTGTTARVSSSRTVSGYFQNYDRNLAVSNDGRFVLLASRYQGVGYPNYYHNVLGDNTGSGVYNWTSLGNGGVIDGGYGSSNTRGAMSCDGAFVAFNNGDQVRLVDVRRGGSITVDDTGSQSTAPALSCNGKYLLYATKNRTKITPTPSGMNTSLHLVRYDRISGERIYIDSNSAGTFTSGFGYSTYPNEPQGNYDSFMASISDSGDVVFRFGSGGNMYLKHLSDGSGTLESIGMDTSGNYVNITSFSEITRDGKYIFFSTNPSNLGLSSSATGNQIIRVKTNL